jgi:hypothetical protein
LPDACPTALALGAEWGRLPAIVRRLHEPGGAAGRFEIQRGPGWLAALCCRLGGLPRPGTDVSTHLAVTARPGAYEWSRRFGAEPLVTWQRVCAPGRIAERLGPIECEFVPMAGDDGLEYRQTAAAVCLGPLRLPLPRPLSPRVGAWARAADDAMQVEVTLDAPLIGRLMRYRGRVRPVEAR